MSCNSSLGACGLTVASVPKRILFSPLFWALATAVSSLFWLPTQVALGVVICILALITAYRKRFLYEVTLSYGYIMNWILGDKWPVYNKITDNLYLGRLPLKSKCEHLILQKEGVGAVLSAVELFENNSLSIFAEPITPNDWKVLGVQQLQIESSDFQPLSIASFQKGVDFIDSQIKQGKKVYVHCKAGRGRSAALVVAYLRKKESDKFVSTKDCLAYVKSCRPLITLNDDKVESIEAFLAL